MAMIKRTREAFCQIFQRALLFLFYGRNPDTEKRGMIKFIVSSAISWGAYYYFARLMGPMGDDPAFFASILLLAVLIHEAGHWIAFELNGIKTAVVVWIIISGAAPLRPYHSKVRKLSWSRQITVLLAGVMGNVAMTAVFLIFYLRDMLTIEQFAIVAVLNGLLIVYNLVPFWILDGGRVVRYLHASMPPRAYLRFSELTMATFAGLALYLRSRYGFADFIACGLLLYGLFRMHIGRPHKPHRQRKLTGMQRRIWALTYIALLCIGLVSSMTFFFMT